MQNEKAMKITTKCSTIQTTSSSLNSVKNKQKSKEKIQNRQTLSASTQTLKQSLLPEITLKIQKFGQHYAVLS